MIHPYGNPARDEVEDHQALAEASYYTARSALAHGCPRRAVTNQQRARINSAAARAAYTAWLEVRT
jgi:hypothetical protein